MEAAGIIILLLILAIIIRFAAGGMDKDRVGEYVAKRGGRLLSSTWEPFGRGWIGEKGDRIYSVRYLDASGLEHSAVCKTSMWSGVYFTEDQIVENVPAQPALVPMKLPVARETTDAPFRIHGLDHVQLAMPPGQEEAARNFYAGVLGLTEVRKPANLAARGGVWFEGGSLRLHMGVDPDFRPARKAHPALLVENLNALTTQLEQSGVKVVTDEPLEGYRRIYVADPFGNRIELIEPVITG